MKTLNSVISENPEYSTLIKAVIKGIGGMECVSDVNNNGINGGYGDFIYYSDTHKFAMKFRSDIKSLLENDSDSLGEEVFTMVAGFGVFRNSPMDYEDKKELGQYLSTGKNSQSTITKLMAWFAAETVCRMFED